ncbi:MAG: peptide deformylase [Clostridiales bacterium]|nr:peptide deformylase [Clostridiales bacterium]
MIRPIVKDTFFLQQKSQPATPADAAHGQDLLDTLNAHLHECVGMAGNMIGVNKRIIVIRDGHSSRLMYNPVLLGSMGPYTQEEGCLSLSGTRTAQRFNIIRVKFQDENFLPREETFTGFTAAIVQHEMAHLDGILI